jgi:hypothetical protein
MTLDEANIHFCNERSQGAKSVLKDSENYFSWCDHCELPYPKDHWRQCKGRYPQYIRKDKSFTVFNQTNQTTLLKLPGNSNEPEWKNATALLNSTELANGTVFINSTELTFLANSTGLLNSTSLATPRLANATRLVNTTRQANNTWSANSTELADSS